jgi:hypothetical protein
MRGAIIMCVMIFGMVSCTTSRYAKTDRAALRAERAEKKRVAVEGIVESGNYLIKMDRLYAVRGNSPDLIPENNFLIYNNGQVRMRLAYLGRQHWVLPIAGINLQAKAESYEVMRNPEKGRYSIRMKVNQKGEQFEILLNIDDRGNCTASVFNAQIETARYRGTLHIPETLAGR